jgi:hypothetical protein
VHTWMVGMTLGEEGHLLLPAYSGLGPHGILRHLPCPRGLDVSHMWPLVIYFLHFSICKGLNEGSAPLKTLLCYVI